MAGQTPVPDVAGSVDALLRQVGVDSAGRGKVGEHVRDSQGAGEIPSKAALPDPEEGSEGDGEEEPELEAADQGPAKPGSSKAGGVDLPRIWEGIKRVYKDLNSMDPEQLPGIEDPGPAPGDKRDPNWQRRQFQAPAETQSADAGGKGVRSILAGLGFLDS